MNQRGFISLSPTGYIYLAVALAFVGLTVALKIQTARLDSVKAESAAFKAEVKANGELANKLARAKEAEDLKRKEKADADYKKLLSLNTVLNQRLRDNSRSSVLPSPGPSAGSLETACFGRGELDAALQRFTGGTAELVIEGQQAVDSLNVAREWAQSQ